MPTYRLGEHVYEVRLEADDPAQHRWRLQVGVRTIPVRVLHREGARWFLEVDGQQVVVHAQWDGVRGWVTHQGVTWQAERGPRSRRAEGGHGPANGDLRAPMPALVRAVQVEPGQAVTAGQTLVLLEAMKMELRIQAPFDGVAQEVRVRPGDTVERDALLVVVRPAT